MSAAPTVRRVKIAGLSTYVPPKLLTNQDLEKLVETSNEWILQRTGIKQRHIVEPGVATSDLAKEAAIGAMKQAGVTPEQIGFIVVGTTTPDTIFPSTACLLQNKIGATHAWAEVFLPGAGWKGFDPTIGTIVGTAGVGTATVTARRRGPIEIMKHRRGHMPAMTPAGLSEGSGRLSDIIATFGGRKFTRAIRGVM